MINSTVYDLETLTGQQQALEDIINELNQQYDSTTNTKSLQIVASDTVAITLNTPPWTGDPIVIFNHNLGYEPVFFIFFGTIEAPGMISTPLVDFSDLFGLRGSVNFYTDKQSLYVKWDSTAQTATQQVTYIIFAKPIVNN